MKPSPFTNRSRIIHCSAFTRAEAIALIAMLSLLLVIVLPALALDRARSERVICANNLRQISAAQQVWGNDHNDLPPVMVPVNEGGTRVHPLAANPWVHFAALSNELATAKILACPSDTGRIAEDFSFFSERGYLQANNRNAVTGYFVAYSASGSDPGWAVIGGDRNVTIDTSASCSFFNSAASIISRSAAGRWSTNLHNLNGNVMLRDGRVEMVSSTELRNLLDQQVGDFPSAKHVAIPR